MIDQYKEIFTRYDHFGNRPVYPKGKDTVSLCHHCSGINLLLVSGRVLFYPHWRDQTMQTCGLLEGYSLIIVHEVWVRVVFRGPCQTTTNQYPWGGGHLPQLFCYIINMALILQSHTIYAIFAYIWLISMVNVDKYTSPMDAMGLETSLSPKKVRQPSLASVNSMGICPET